ncbi:hypothetical protein PILCRDRAFT_11347 [Piloderma croceum F 1598]|uniref:Uncharacterized protein n=1 Tax=Piloderma croceum (strain F 1598) TaxID=765440 RepID=A0A0C3F0S0_PILCF|nr:hypothetical protein PILCRDRAFT_11347 [Piloderma croceum F 1598]
MEVTQCQDRQRTDKNNATQDAVHAAAEALMHKLIPDHNLLSPLPSHSERVRLFHHFRHSHKWAFQRAAAFAVFLRGGTKNFDFANYCIIFDVRYRLRCGGNPRLAYSVLDVNIRPLADFLAENPSVQTVMAANKPALDDVIALRSNTIPDFGGFFPSVYYWQEYGGYFISHPTPIHHHPEIDCRGPYMRACHEWKEDLQKTTEAGIVYQYAEEHGRWKPGRLKVEGSKWRWNELTSKELVEHGLSVDFPGYLF